MQQHVTCVCIVLSFEDVALLQCLTVHNIIEFLYYLLLKDVEFLYFRIFLIKLHIPVYNSVRPTWRVYGITVFMYTHNKKNGKPKYVEAVSSHISNLRDINCITKIRSGNKFPRENIIVRFVNCSQTSLILVWSTNEYNMILYLSNKY